MICATRLPLIGLLVLLLASNSFGEKKYPTMKGAITDPKQAGPAKTEARRALSSGDTSESAKRALLNYYCRYLISGMTTENALMNPTTLPSSRIQLRAAMSRSKNKAQHDYLLQSFYKYLKHIAGSNNYSPAARYNAMLALGDLNDSELRRPSGKPVVPPRPNANARKLLLSYLNSKKESPDALCIAAVIGLKRHAIALSLANKPDSAIADEMLKIVRRKEAPESISTDGHHWMQKLAVETLGAMGMTSAAPDLKAIAANETAPLFLRCSAAEALGSLNYSEAKEGGADLAKLMGKIAVTAVKDELTRLEARLASDDYDERPREQVRRMEERNNDDMNNNVEIIVHPIVQDARRQLLSQINCVHSGISNAKKTAAKNADESKQFDAIEAQLANLQELLMEEAKSLLPVELPAKIAMSARDLEQLVQ